VTATDACGAPAVTLVSVISSEPDDAPGGGDGSTTGDVADADIGTSDLALGLRAERAGSGPGRTYTVVYSAADRGGNTVEASANVFVPHDVGGGVPIGPRSAPAAPSAAGGPRPRRR
jgi:hypothetical protein